MGHDVSDDRSAEAAESRVDGDIHRCACVGLALYMYSVSQYHNLQIECNTQAMRGTTHESTSRVGVARIERVEDETD